MPEPTSAPPPYDLGKLPEKLRRFFLSRGVRTEDEAREMAQETILRVLQRIQRGDELGSVEAFALGVAKNVFFEYCRKVARTNSEDGISSAVELAGGPTPFTDALVRSRQFLVRRALGLLPSRMRQLLLRRFVEEVPSRVIAREEGISTDAVDMRVYRAKKELKKKVEENRSEGGTEP